MVSSFHNLIAISLRIIGIQNYQLHHLRGINQTSVFINDVMPENFDSRMATQLAYSGFGRSTASLPVPSFSFYNANTGHYLVFLFQ